MYWILTKTLTDPNTEHVDLQQSLVQKRTRSTVHEHMVQYAPHPWTRCSGQVTPDEELRSWVFQMPGESVRNRQ